MTDEQLKIFSLLKVDLNQTLPRFMNDESFYLRILEKFTNEKTFSLLEESMAKKDYKNVFLHAHTLKGLASNLGLDSMLDTLIPLISEVRNGEPYNEPEISSLFSQLKNSYTVMLEILKKL